MIADRVPRLADDPRGGADEHERAVPVALHLAEEAARGQEDSGQVLAQGQLPTFERELQAASGEDLSAVVAGGAYVANRTLLNDLQDEMELAVGPQHGEVRERIRADDPDAAFPANEPDPRANPVVWYGIYDEDYEKVGGEWKIKHPGLQPLFNQARNLLSEFGRVDLAWHPRAKSVRTFGH